MHEAIILETLSSLRRPVSIGEVREILASALKKRIPYETVKRDLMALAARGEIHSKSMGKGRRISWVFWASERSAGQVAVHEPDPFELSLTERDALESEQLSRLYDILLTKYGGLIKERLRAGSRFLVLCNGGVVHSSDHEVSDEVLSNLERRYGKPCYAVTEDIVEEASWSALDDDSYPTVQVFIGLTDWQDEQVFESGLRFVADFDTGNPDLAAFGQEYLTGLKPSPMGALRRGIHLGRYYDYHVLEAKICMQDVNGRRRCAAKLCRSVMWWQRHEKNPFLLANPNRKAFVGRDLMMKFPFDILLSGKEKTSRTYFT